MGCVWGEGELWEQNYNLAILTEKTAKQNNRNPPDKNKKNPVMRSGFEAPYYGNIDKLERVQKQTEQKGKKASEGLDYS